MSAGLPKEPPNIRESPRVVTSEGEGELSKRVKGRKSRPQKRKASPSNEEPALRKLVKLESDVPVKEEPSDDQAVSDTTSSAAELKPAEDLVSDVETAVSEDQVQVKTETSDSVPSSSAAAAPANEEKSSDNEPLEEDVKICDICGHAGIEHRLAVCTLCNVGAEHIYCMETLLEELPVGDWFCYECKRKQGVSVKPVGTAQTLGERKSSARKDVKELAVLRSKKTDTSKLAGAQSHDQTTRTALKDSEKARSPFPGTARVTITTGQVRHKDAAFSRPPRVPKPALSLLRDQKPGALKKVPLDLRRPEQPKDGKKGSEQSKDVARKPQKAWPDSPRPPSSTQNTEKTKTLSEALEHPTSAAVDVAPASELQKAANGNVQDLKNAASDDSAKSLKAASEGDEPCIEKACETVTQPRVLEQSVREKSTSNVGAILGQVLHSSKPSAQQGIKDAASFSFLRDSKPGVTRKVSKDVTDVPLKKRPEEGSEQVKDAVRKGSPGPFAQRTWPETPRPPSDETNTVEKTSEPEIRTSEAGESAQKTSSIENGSPASLESEDATNTLLRTPSADSEPKVCEPVVHPRRDEQETKSASHVSAILGQVLDLPQSGKPPASQSTGPSYSFLRDTKPGTKTLPKEALDMNRKPKDEAALRRSGSRTWPDTPRLASETSTLEASDIPLEPPAAKLQKTASIINGNVEGVTHSSATSRDDGAGEPSKMKAAETPRPQEQAAKSSLEKSSSNVSAILGQVLLDLPQPGKPITPQDTNNEAIPQALSPTSESQASYSSPSGVLPGSIMWRGDFEVNNASGSIVSYEGMQARPSSNASAKVLHATNRLSFPLKLQELQRTTSWPKKFINAPPTDHDIALYFFSTDDESCAEQYNQLLERLMKFDLIMKSVVDHAELLVIPSNMLSEPFRYWQSRRFLWGVFRDRKGRPPLQTAAGSVYIPALVSLSTSVPPAPLPPSVSVPPAMSIAIPVTPTLATVVTRTVAVLTPASTAPVLEPTPVPPSAASVAPNLPTPLVTGAAPASSATTNPPIPASPQHALLKEMPKEPLRIELKSRTDESKPEDQPGSLKRASSFQEKEKDSSRRTATRDKRQDDRRSYEKDDRRSYEKERRERERDRERERERRDRDRSQRDRRDKEKLRRRHRSRSRSYSPPRRRNRSPSLSPRKRNRSPSYSPPRKRNRSHSHSPPAPRKRSRSPSPRKRSRSRSPRNTGRQYPRKSSTDSLDSFEARRRRSPKRQHVERQALLSVSAAHKDKLYHNFLGDGGDESEKQRYLQQDLDLLPPRNSSSNSSFDLNVKPFVEIDLEQVPAGSPSPSHDDVQAIELWGSSSAAAAAAKVEGDPLMLSLAAPQYRKVEAQLDAEDVNFALTL